MKAPREGQGCYCPVCGHVFTLAITGTYLVPIHNHDGRRCAGSGTTAKTISAGLHGGPQPRPTPERNGQVERRFGRPGGNEY